MSDYATTHRGKPILPGSSWEATKGESRRYAASADANAAAEAIVALMAASRKRSFTVQWMPAHDGTGCRFEVIGVHTGNELAVATVDAEGRVTLTTEDQS